MPSIVHTQTAFDRGLDTIRRFEAVLNSSETLVITRDLRIISPTGWIKRFFFGDSGVRYDLLSAKKRFTKKLNHILPELNTREEAGVAVLDQCERAAIAFNRLAEETFRRLPKESEVKYDDIFIDFDKVRREIEERKNKASSSDAPSGYDPCDMASENLPKSDAGLGPVCHASDTDSSSSLSPHGVPSHSSPGANSKDGLSTESSNPPQLSSALKGAEGPSPHGVGGLGSPQLSSHSSPGGSSVPEPKAPEPSQVIRKRTRHEPLPFTMNLRNSHSKLAQLSLGSPPHDEAK